MIKFKSLREETNLDEAFGMFVVPIPKQTLNGKKIGGNSITVKARTAREAIQKAAKELGVDFKFLKTGKVTKESVQESYTSLVAEANMSDVKKQLGKIKGLSKDAYDQLITLPMPVLTTMVNQLSGIVSSTQVESVNENQVMSAQFKVGDMPNSDLHTSIEKLKTAKKKADAQKPKVSDPVLVKSLNDVISEIDKTIKDAEKVQATASKAIAKVAPSIKRTFELINRKKYLVASTGNQLDESINLKEAFNIEKGAKVKMKAGSDKDLYGTVVKGVETKGFKVNGKQGILVRWSNKVLGAFEVDQFAAASMDRKADYQIVDDGVRFDN